VKLPKSLAREGVSRSWCDPEYGKIMAAQFRSKLLARCRGRKGLFLTLTYRRDEWGGPHELWRAQGDEQHVALFMRSLSRAMGVELSGKWVCKAEFQAGGWVHWHIIIVDVAWVAFETLAHCWEHGFVWVKRLNARNIAYCAKYVAKEGGIPSFLMHENRVRIIRTSRGFWGDPPRERSVSPWSQSHRCCYVSVGQRIKASRRRTLLHDGYGRWTSVPVGLFELLSLVRAVLRLTNLSLGGGGRWMGIPLSIDDVVELVNVKARTAREGREAARGLLHLRERQKDDEALVDYVMTDRLIREPVFVKGAP
jgi:hypothetical protein